MLEFVTRSVEGTSNHARTEHDIRHLENFLSVYHSCPGAVRYLKDWAKAKGMFKTYKCKYHRSVIPSKALDNPSSHIASQQDGNGRDGHKYGRHGLDRDGSLVLIRHV